MGLLAAIALSWFVWYFHTLVDKAADYEKLKQVNAALVTQHNQDSASAARAAIDLVNSETARRLAAESYIQWQREQKTSTDQLRKMIDASAVSKNPVCRPTAAERKLWNDTLAFAIH
jgi:hypothetical protein